MILLQKGGDVAEGYGQSISLFFFEKRGKRAVERVQMMRVDYREPTATSPHFLSSPLWPAAKPRY
jgi:hypothetical protein